MLLGILIALSVLTAVALGIAVDILWLIPVFLVGGFLVYAALAFGLLLLICAFIDPEKPRENDNPHFRKMIMTYIHAVLTILPVKIRAKGLEKTPKDGRFLLVCNHIDILDPVVLLAHFKKCQLAFISKRENASMFIVGKIMHKIQCQRINRENDKEALRTIINCIKIIQEDKASVGVFPEGYTSLDGLLHSFRSGVFKIAQKANVPIVVCTVQNTNKPFRNIKKLKRTDVHLHLIKVLQPEALAGKTAVEVGDMVHSLMAEDLGPDLVLQENANEEN